MPTWYKPRVFIDGEFTDAENRQTLDVINPYTGAAIGAIPDCTATDVTRAISAARQAFESVWYETPGIERARLMNKLADLLDREAQNIARLETEDVGKLNSEALDQAHFSARMYRFYAGYADRISGRTIPLDRHDLFDYTLMEPRGVAALITAWNSPMQLLSNKLAPALAAGCTVVVKPSEEASLSTLKFAELIQEAGFPPGVVNIVAGGIDCGRALSESDAIDTLSFTGSVPTGRTIAQSTAANHVPVTLELGGKSPNIVFEDANIDEAVEGAVAGIFSASGQTCVAGSRLLVQESIRDVFVEKVAERASKLQLGDPMDPGTDLGPLANKAQYKRVRNLIQRAVDTGQHCIEAVTSTLPPEGFFIGPKIFPDLDNASELAQTEVFGPVLSIISFRTEEEAIRIANSSKFGLASGVWTQNLSRAHRMARRIKAGTVWINTYRVAAAQAPFGGRKHSGHGRERGEEALYEYLAVKNVMIKID